ncbi:PadR family transcriptional regulator [Polymorphum gilvum]|nr:PadR family transcriptional regulator [Polymorphum gilvum]
MSVRSLCLAILSFGDATGYEIRKESTEGKFSYFEDASFGSIYPTLARLEVEGLVTVRREAQQGKPARKVYSITEAGREELRRALSEPLAPDTFRSPFLLVSMYADMLGSTVVRRAIDRQIEQVRAELEQMKAMAEGCRHASSLWTMHYGISCMTNTLNFLETHRDRLLRIAEGDTDLPAAAE